MTHVTTAAARTRAAATAADQAVPPMEAAGQKLHQKQGPRWKLKASARRQGAQAASATRGNGRGLPRFATLSHCLRP